MMSSDTVAFGAALPSGKDAWDGADYSEEAIPERDPGYRTPGGTLHEDQTVDAVPADVRHALRRALEQLGMSPARAAAVASL
jgi:hypothetical protein